jgi:nitrogen-specific signal transduction histidine kinase
MVRLFGVSIEESLGRRLAEESPAFAREPVFDRMRGVVDTGVPVLVESVVGIPPELGDDAFAMFRRAGAIDEASCGIGLAVCRRIVEAHGGAIAAAPAPGGGTAMRFSLPG